ncbi:MAG: TraV family lipoprotein [Rhodospirillaceae bacterium]|nr:TraV family lipoprotein [Rhodospirillaceae bacterium]
MAERRSRRAAGPLVSAAAVLALTGCAADYVGDDWQCPPAQGKVCASVAAADPAVPEALVPETLAPETRGTANPVHDAPFYRRIDGRIAAGAPAGRVDEPACRSDCDPFAWLAGLFAGPSDSESGEAGRTDAARDADIENTGAAVSRRKGEPGTAGGGQTASDAHAAGSAAIASDMPQDAPPPTAGEAETDESSDPSVAADAHRIGEVVARIWIAPFVDADGIYREGSWVRAVIAPAAWRLP